MVSQEFITKYIIWWLLDRERPGEDDWQREEENKSGNSKRVGDEDIGAH